MLSTFKPKIDKILDPLLTPLAKVDPNLVTILTLVTALGYYWAMTESRYVLAFIFLVLSIFDALDGALARKYNKVTAFGGFLDSTLDRIADGIFIASFASAGLVSWPLTYAVFIVIILISYARSRAELAAKGKIKLNVGLMERTERIVVIGVMNLLLAVGINPVVGNYTTIEWIFLGLLIVSLITLGQRIRAAKKLLG